MTVPRLDSEGPASSQGAPLSVAQVWHDLFHLIGYSDMLAEQLEDWGEVSRIESITATRNAAKDALLFIQQVFPPGKGSLGPGLNCLRPKLDSKVEAILGFLSVARSAPPSVHDSEIRANLDKIRAGADGLRAMLRELDRPAADQPLRSLPALPSLPAIQPGRGTTETSPQPKSEPKLDPKLDVMAESPAVSSASLLVVDDNDANRDLLLRRLERDGYRVSPAASGYEALDMLATGKFDLVLLDVMMPGIDGFGVLQRLKSAGRLADLPVIMISATDEVQSAVRCIELGAEDYLTKPFDPILLRARIGACLEKKHLRDQERRRSEQLRLALMTVGKEKQRSESLLLNILPAKISEELRTHGKVKPKYFDDVTIVFTDFVGFTLSTESLAADELVEMLDEHFTAFDRIVRRYGLEKLKTTGDSYMFMGGLPPRSPSHPVDAIMACMKIAHYVEERLARSPNGSWDIRIGLHTGPVIAGVVGIEKFAFDVWGETVNYSSRMEASGEPGRINLSERCYSRIKDFFECESRGKVLTKEQRAFEMYFVKSVRAKLMDDLSELPPPQFVKRHQTYFERSPPSFPELLAGPEFIGGTP